MNHYDTSTYSVRLSYYTTMLRQIVNMWTAMFILNLSLFSVKKSWLFTVFCRGCNFATISLKKSKCCIQNRLGAPFVAYEFAWGWILNKYAVISPDKQDNDRKVSNCLSLTCSLFVLFTTLKQCIHLKWPLNILNHVSHSHLLMSSRIKLY